jgi:hypothetical protein
MQMGSTPVQMNFPVASPISPAGFVPGAPGGIVAPQLGLIPVTAAPMPAGMQAIPPPGAIPLSAFTPTQAPTPPPAAAATEVAQMRSEMAELRNEVVSSNKDMWNAVKLITSTVEKDETTMQALTQDVQTLRGRHGGSVPQVATECSMRQSSCGDCVSVPSCVWCKVEQRCYSGDSAGPVRGECSLFRHGTCDAR